MDKSKRLILIILAAIWIVFPDLIPGPIDDLIITVFAVYQGIQMAKEGRLPKSS